MSARSGLSSAEAAARLLRDGPNIVQLNPRKKGLRLLLRQFESPIILILFVATGIAMAAGELLDGAIILGIIIPSGILGFWQEHRAAVTMDSLLARVQVYSEVVRDGVERSVPSSELVVGDVVLLKVGDLVPADLCVLEAESLMVDESVLTGEAFPREKSAGTINTSLPLTERESALYLGTHVVSGFCTGEVVHTGFATEFGALSLRVTSDDITTEFERGTRAFGMLLLHSMLTLVAILFLANIVLHRPFIDSVLFSLALAVGLTPQLLPVIISVSLSSGARRMAEQRVVVKRLDAIEDFGVMNVLCTDKTGTLTTGAIKLSSTVNYLGENDEHLLHLAFLNSSLQRGFENPLDRAIIEVTRDKYPSGTSLGENPYDFIRRRLSILVEDDVPFMVTKGSFESVLSVCTSIYANGVAVALEEHLSDITSIFTRITESGNRVLVMATKAMPGRYQIEVDDESEMTFLGFLVFEDEVKPDAKEVVTELEQLGIELVLVTGDNRSTAKAIAKQVGMNVDSVIVGSELSKMSDLVLSSKVYECRVFAEVDPLQKERIVRAFRAGGATVGYFGDGVNDSAALHAADVGISVDTAVDVARHAAAIVLLDKDLHVIGEGVRLGRRTFINTLKYVRVGVSAAFGNVLSMAIADLFLPFLPLLPFQILLLNFLTDFPALAIAGDSVDSEALEKPCSWNIKSIRNFMLVFGLLSSLFDIVTFVVLRVGYFADDKLFRTGWFVESTLTELVVMLVLRTQRRFWQSKPGKGLLWSSACLATIAVSIPFLPIRTPLGFSSLPFSLIVVLTGMIFIYAALNEVAKDRWKTKGL